MFLASAYDKVPFSYFAEVFFIVLQTLVQIVPKHMRQTSLGVLSDPPGYPGINLRNSGHLSRIECVFSLHTLQE